MSAALVIVDMQNIFADEESQWFCEGYEEAQANVEKLIASHQGPVIFTKFVRDPAEDGSWSAYYDRWDRCREPEDSPVWDVTIPIGEDHHVITLPTFGKWGEEMERLTAENDQLIVCGVATDCCVISTVLAAVDTGKTITVVEDACAGATEKVHREAISLMDMLSPMVRLVETSELV